MLEYTRKYQKELRLHRSRDMVTWTKVCRRTYGYIKAANSPGYIKILDKRIPVNQELIDLRVTPYIEAALDRFV